MTERTVSVTLNIDTTAFTRALRRAGDAAHRFGVAMRRDPRSIRRHRARCGVCSPRANPVQLSIDGHAYRRRTKKRGNRR